MKKGGIFCIITMLILGTALLTATGCGKSEDDATTENFTSEEFTNTVTTESIMTEEEISTSIAETEFTEEASDTTELTGEKGMAKVSKCMDAVFDKDKNYSFY